MDVPPEFAGWALWLDEVERLLHRPGSREAPRGNAVSDAFAQLYAYEHDLAPAARQQAREWVWQQDFPDTPLPDERAWWALCQCQDCAITRRLERARQPPAAHEVQRRVLQRQRRS